jgi:hypothetical protein
MSERGRENVKPEQYRRVVTANINGRSDVQSDEPIETYEFRSVPGYLHTLVWVNAATPDLRRRQTFGDYPESVVPGPGGTSLHFVTFPPRAVFADPSFDREAARRETLVRLRGFAASARRSRKGSLRMEPAWPSPTRGTPAQLREGIKHFV